MHLRLLCAVCLLFISRPALADIQSDIAALAPSGIVLVLDSDGKELVARNVDQTFVPASTAKIVTAWLAIEVLGRDHRFETRFYMDDDRMLYVRGGGDPFLVSEELALLAPKLIAATGPEPFAGIVLDGSYFPDDLRIPGIEETSEAYDAPNSALAVNFNTIHAVRNGNSVRSAEEQTPITPLAESQFRERGPNGRGRISLPQNDISVAVRYAGELIAAFIEDAGGSVAGDISIGPVREGLEPVYVHRQSRSLPEILKLMLLGSNNFIANQIFLEIGAHGDGGPASLGKSLAKTDAILAEHGLADEIDLEEGSGIGRGNRFTARGLAGVLDQSAPHADLLRTSRGGSRFKTGTIPGASTLAGYANTKENGTVRFVIALGGGTGNLRFRLLQAIERGL